MRTNKCQQFVFNLQGVLSNYSTYGIKEKIGDSVDNNRTPTVSQVIRFLDSIGYVSLANTLNVLYRRLNADLKLYRNTTNFRTDAVDINEFLVIYADITTNAATVRSLSQVI